MRNIDTLRVSVARIAQSMGIDNHLGVTGKTYEQLFDLSERRDEGWNDLCARIQEHAERLQQENEDLRRQYHENEANATTEGYAGSYVNPILEDQSRPSSDQQTVYEGNPDEWRDDD